MEGNPTDNIALSMSSNRDCYDPENDEIAKLNGFQHNNFGNFFVLCPDFQRIII